MPHILIIDDDAQILELLRQTLESKGYQVACAADGVEGLRLFRDQAADSIITDIHMPEKDGLEVVQEIRRVSSDVKIIAMSGGGRAKPDVFLKVAGHLGVNRTFEKPFRPTAIVQAVRELLAGAT